MNKKERAAVEALIAASDSMASLMFFGGTSSQKQAKLDALKEQQARVLAMLNPPVRFVWLRRGSAPSGMKYRASAGRFNYHVEQNYDNSSGTSGWSSWVRPEGEPLEFGPKEYMGKVHMTLDAAKQACVAHGRSHSPSPGAPS